MNLVLARACSNSCPYCFEAAERKAEKQNFISLENVNKLAAWARDSNLQLLSLLGGEPFLHPELGEIVATFKQLTPQTALQIFTGGVFDPGLLDILSPNDTGIIFNVNEPKDYKNIKQFNIVFNNIDSAIRKGFLAVLGFNVWREDFDVSFMPSLANHFGRTRFRWTVANPQWGCRTNVVHPSKYGALAERCFSMLRAAAQLNIITELDCPLPLCFFNEPQLAWISQYHPGTASRIGCCEPVLDVTPELEVMRCFALSDLARVNVTDFPNENAIWHWFLQQADFKLLPEGCFSRCSSCQHFVNGRCNGGCLAWHKGIINTADETEAQKLTQRMQEALSAGNPALALERFDGAGHWSRMAIPKYIAACANLQLGNNEQAFRYAAQALDLTTNPNFRKTICDFMACIPTTGYKANSKPRGGNNQVDFISNL